MKTFEKRSEPNSFVKLVRKTEIRQSLLWSFVVAGVLAVCLTPQQSLAAQASGSAGSDEFHLTYDVGGSFGTAYNRSYQEFSLGLNAHFKSWFVWRNSIFGRFVEGADNVYGLDTSGRFVLNLGDSKLGLTAFAGPGYRFATSSGQLPADSAPFVEAGLVAKLGGISIGGGVKTVYNNFVRTGAPQDTQVFLILAGGGSL